MLHPTIFNTSQICNQLGVEYAVMSPGSRNAPLTISFARHSKIKKFIIPDERTAGFIALGIAQKTKSPVVLCCTSGTALLNYAPAIAEAYYREIPLIVMSADRPSHLIDQRDGQTIRQFEALRNHVKASYQFPLINGEIEASQFQNQLVEGFQLAQSLPKGPIHFNIPFEEPFYPISGSNLEFARIDIDFLSTKPISSPIEIDIQSNQKILILVGQCDYSKELSDILGGLEEQIPIIKSPLNNLQIKGIEHVDAFVEGQSDLQPDILITFGLSVLSKKLKTFLRKHNPKQHFHIDPSGIEIDTYESNPTLIQANFKDVIAKLDFSNVNQEYLKQWSQLNRDAKLAIESYFEDSIFCESSSFKVMVDSLPKRSHLHLGNSMPVRFADLFGVPDGVNTWSNRGTSGIDGCSSTAVGTSLVYDELNVLFSGDVSFLYDRNAFFHNYPLPNLRIIVFNNQGGGIFRLIDGPANLPELEDYFETRHSRTAKYICLENDMDYCEASSFEELNKALELFYEPSTHAKVLEVFTSPETNQTEFKKLKNYINEYITN